MDTAGDGYETGGPGVGRGLGGGAGAGQNLEEDAGSRKRKAAAVCQDSNNLAGNGEGLEVECEDSKISLEIENLRSDLDGAVKELGYNEVDCVRKQKEELQAKHKKQDEELQAKHKKQNEELQAKHKKQNEELQAKHKKQNDELLAKYEKQNEELQAKHEGLRKSIMEILENQIDAQTKHLQHLDGLYSIMEFQLTQLDEDKSMLDKSCNEGSDSKMIDESSAEVSGVNGKTDDENLKLLEQQLAKLDAEIQIKMDKLGEMLECEKFSEELGSATVWKSIQTNIELQGSRNVLIKDFVERPLRPGDIGVKFMGEVSDLSLIEACRQMYGNDEAKIRATTLTSLWGEEVRNPSWRPFKIVEADGKLHEVVDDDDAKLKQLQAEYGDAVCNAVKTALIEMNEYNPSGGFPVAELWNFKEGRKATVKEVLRYMFSMR